MLLNSSRSPVYTLPVELVACIFLYTLPEPDGLRILDPRPAQVLLRSVCRHWRAVTENIAAFWSTIFVRLPTVSDKNTSIKMLENAERWSANNTLSIYVVQHEIYEPPFPDPEGFGRKFLFTIRRLLPRMELLHLDTDADDTDIRELFPLEKASPLRCLILGRNASLTLDPDILFYHDGDDGLLDVFSFEKGLIYGDYSFLRRASPRNLFLRQDSLYETPLDVIDTIPSLEYLHMTGSIRTVVPAYLSSSSIISLDVELSHDTKNPAEGIEVIGSLPNLTHLVIRVAETISVQRIRYPPLLHDCPGLPVLKTVTIGMDTHATDGRFYTLCDCIATLLPRAPSIVALEVHQGHALGALRHLDGTGKLWGAHDIPYPNLELLRIVFTSPVPIDRPAIVQSCLHLLEEGPSLRIEWHKHQIPNAYWRKAGWNGRDKDYKEFESWQDLPDGVKNGVECFWDGHEASLAGLYSVEQL